MRIAVAFVLVSSAASAAAPIPDQGGAGTIHCPIIRDITHYPLIGPARIEVCGGIARMQRNILIPDTMVPYSSHFERSQGAVGPDGALVLDAAGDAEGGSFTAPYRGVLGPSRQAHFEGVQHWRFNIRPSFDRPCTLDLQRQK